MPGHFAGTFAGRYICLKHLTVVILLRAYLIRVSLCLHRVVPRGERDYLSVVCALRFASNVIRAAAVSKHTPNECECDNTIPRRHDKAFAAYATGWRLVGCPTARTLWPSSGRLSGICSITGEKVWELNQGGSSQGHFT